MRKSHSPALWRLILPVLAVMGFLTALAATGPARADARPPLDAAMDAVLVVRSADAADRFLGSAFVWGAGEVAVTNAHVVGEAAEVRLVDRAGNALVAPVIARDAVRDVAVLGLPAGGAAGLQPGPVPALGAPVWALGAPLGIDFTATRGMVSASARQVEPAVPLRLLQHDAAVNPGSSGGPLIDAQGRVVGMNSRIADGSRHYIGIAYAIAAPDLARIVDGLIAETLPPVPKLGLHLRPVTRQIAQALGLPAEGLLVDRVEAASPADRAGLRPGDVILTAGGAALTAAGDLAFAVEGAGDALPVTLWRAGVTQDAAIPLDPAPDTTLALRDLSGSAPARVAAYDFAALGVTLGKSGLVTAVSDNSPALLAGLAPGDVILMLNGQALDDAALAAARIEAAALLLVKRANGGTSHLMLDPWDRGAGLRPVGGANVLDPAVVLF